jgi:adenylate kinase family enzyme
MALIENRLGKRINIVGTSGSGKTSLANEIAQRLGYKHIEMDALYWGPDWTTPTQEDLENRLRHALKADYWVVDGNYSMVRHIIWRDVETVIFLDYSLAVILYRVVTRTLLRGILRRALWNTNRESLFRNLFTRESIILWALQTHKRRREQYPPLFAANPHINVVHLTKPKQAKKLLESL